MKKRENSPELEKTKTVHRGKDTGDQNYSKEEIEEYLNSKPQQMVDLYNELYSELSSQIDGLYESCADNRVYIALKEDTIDKNIAEVRIQKEQIRINIHEPSEEKYKSLGKAKGRNYNWVLDYNIYLKEESKINLVADAIVDSFLQML